MADFAVLEGMAAAQERLGGTTAGITGGGCSAGGSPSTIVIFQVVYQVCSFSFLCITQAEILSE